MTVYNDNGKMTKNIRLKDSFITKFSEEEFYNDKKQKIKLYAANGNLKLKSF